MKYKRLPSAEYLRSRLDYDPETGKLRWKAKSGDTKEIRAWNTRHAGQVAGCLQESGYRTILLDGTHYKAHRLIWVIQTGEPPPYEIDHKDEDKSGNRFENLRSATRSQNQFNTHLRANNTSGYRGVSWNPDWKAWAAQIRDGERNRLIGKYPTREEAAEAYRRAARTMHGDFVHPLV